MARVSSIHQDGALLAFNSSRQNWQKGYGWGPFLLVLYGLLCNYHCHLCFSTQGRQAERQLLSSATAAAFVQSSHAETKMLLQGQAHRPP